MDVLKRNNHFKVGVLAATCYDTQAGVEFLKKAGFNTIPYSISKSPIEQTQLQMNQSELMKKTIDEINYLITKGANCIFIYCNSLSGALDIEELRKKSLVPIITPLETYKEIARNYQVFGLLAANCQSLSHIENTIIKENPRATVIGMSSLALVNSVEEEKSPLKIIKDYQLLDLWKIFKSHGCEIIILGCTHFPYFLDEILEKTKKTQYNLPIIEPSQNMLKQLREIET